MPTFNTELFLFTLALIGAVIMVSALLSGLVERTGLPQVAIFLALGAAIGPAGLGLMDAGIQSPILHVVSTLSLVLVLFTDAVSLNLTEVRTHRLLAILVLGPGTLLSAGLMAGAAYWMLGFTVPMALILASALASNDPVLLRGVLKRPQLSARVKQALRLESGMNDAVLLPIVLVAMTILSKGGLDGAGWSKLMVNILVLSPAAGVLTALAAIGMLEFVRRRIGVRRDYESIYSLGVAFAAFAAAESIHGSGFLAAFAAGIAISALDVELCDCFLEYGETTAEMALMFTFVLFGTSIIWTGFAAITPAALLFTALVFLIRPAAFVPALTPAHLSWRERLQIGWFGPKGLSSLLLILLPVFAGIRGSEPLLTICCLIVLFSVVIHGLSPLLLKDPPGASAAAAGAPSHSPQTITIDEVRGLADTNTLHYIIDSRSERTYDPKITIPGSIRLHPDRPVTAANETQLSREAILAVICA